ncbi:MAG: hypothetical protein LC104_14525 [Bacteroidales bacterium]|nr:hypothetical protein [Bacteroidales bacterium]
MPLYTYTCSDCDREFESLSTRFIADAVPDCPTCGHRNVVRSLPLPARSVSRDPAVNCQGNGPPCGAPWCGRLES